MPLARPHSLPRTPAQNPKFKFRSLNHFFHKDFPSHGTFKSLCIPLTELNTDSPLGSQGFLFSFFFFQSFLTEYLSLIAEVMKDSTLGHSRVSDSSRLAHKNVLPPNPDYKSRMQREREYFFCLSHTMRSLSCLPTLAFPIGKDQRMIQTSKCQTNQWFLRAYVLKEIQSLSCISSFHEISQHTKLRLTSWRKPTSHLFPFLSPTLAHGAQL